MTNCIGSLFNAYPATGSFSRTAVKSKSGVRTPLAGVFTGAMVVIALYALTSAFYCEPLPSIASAIFTDGMVLLRDPQRWFVCHHYRSRW